jgi:PAS domain S-box-containing protein
VLHTKALAKNSYGLISIGERERAFMSADHSEFQEDALHTSAEVVISRTSLEILQRLASIVEYSDDAIISKTIEGTVTSWNGGAERIFGYTAQELIGQSILRLVAAGAEDGMVKCLDKVRRGERVNHYEAIWVCKDGREIPVSVTTSPLRDSSGQIVGVSDISRDITGRKRTEKAMRTAEKLAIVGRLASRIAHDINNPLMSITNLLYLLENEDLSGEGRRYIAITQHELSRLGHISNQALGLYKNSGKPVSASIAAILDDSLALRHNRCIVLGIEVLRDYDLTMTIDCHPGELRQLIVNLVDNALDAMPSGGRLYIRARITTGWATDRRGLRITVADTGCGISVETHSRLFEPFYTTKEASTGLGLWACAHIADKYAGRISMRSSNTGDRSGSVFAVFLPTG